MKMTIRDAARCGLWCAVCAVCAYLTIPAAVPFTMQTFAVCAAAGLLGAKRATWTLAVYLLLGALGLPVFAGFRGGFGVLLGPTGGYLIGFLLIPPCVALAQRALPGKTAGIALGMAAGVVACYAFGTAQFLYLYNRNTGDLGLWGALSVCVIPYLLPDAVKIALACVLTKRLDGKI